MLLLHRPTATRRQPFFSDFVEARSIGPRRISVNTFSDVRRPPADAPRMGGIQFFESAPCRRELSVDTFRRPGVFCGPGVDSRVNKLIKDTHVHQS